VVAGAHSSEGERERRVGVGMGAVVAEGSWAFYRGSRRVVREVVDEGGRSGRHLWSLRPSLARLRRIKVKE
jgi:hypothetical protein